MATTRYFVHDVGTAIGFYERLGFEVVQRFGDTIAIMRRQDLDLWLAGRASSAARPMPDGRRPEPGGWNRFELVVDDIEAEVERLRAAGVPFRNEIVRGPGGAQILAEDPSGNMVELFQPR